MSRNIYLPFHLNYSYSLVKRCRRTVLKAEYETVPVLVHGCVVTGEDLTEAHSMAETRPDFTK
jgi:hypothetical protein